MNDERARWERIQTLLDALEEMPEDAREAYLSRTCPDPELRAETLALFAAQNMSHNYLDGLSARLGRAPGRTGPQDMIGRHIGAYRLLRLLGQGGMGVVYEAERADDAFEQKVALKFLTTALTDTEAHNRFLIERRILAGLKHPAIAHIIDGGVDESGTPWFTMEYVEGVSINDYCDQQRLRIRERLELFLQVCDAVQHAHNRLVVHRDLKPANVLVGNGGQTKPSERPGGDGKGGRQVKLLDFGIAKLLDTEHADTAPPTRTTLRLMTPEYASPEQVRGEEVTTASDVYQLGLLLYELLTGHRPYVLRHRGISEIERVICHQRPARPSSVVTREDATGPTPSRDSEKRVTASVDTICRVRRSSPARLKRRLRGDLENIALKALSKEPERRYASVDRLAQDIRRHLGGHPVTARADTWLYRGRKFLQRHTVGAATAAVVFTLMVSMTAFYTARIQSERNLAQAEAAKAEQVSEFLAGLFRSADPRETRGAELTARQLLDRGVERVNNELTTQPEVQADMLHVLGRTYLELSLYGPAERILGRALELRRGMSGPGHPDIARIMADLGLLSFRRGEHEQARAWLEESVENFEASPGDGVSHFTNALARLGNVYKSLGKHEQSRAALERALAAQIQDSGENSEPVAIILHSMGVLLSDSGNHKEAEIFHERALAIYESALGPEHPHVGNILINLANARVSQNNFEGVRAMHERGVAILEQTYGPDHTMVGVALHGIAHYLIISGQSHDALEVLQRALSIYTAAFGPRHPDIAYPHASLGNAYMNIGRLEQSRYHYEQALAVRMQTSETQRFDNLLFSSLINLGLVEERLGNDADAGSHFQRALTAMRQTADPTPIRGLPLFNLGRWLVEQERCAEAIPLLERITASHTARQDLSDRQVDESRHLLAVCAASSLDIHRGIGTISGLSPDFQQYPQLCCAAFDSVHRPLQAEFHPISPCVGQSRGPPAPFFPAVACSGTSGTGPRSDEAQARRRVRFRRSRRSAQLKPSRVQARAMGRFAEGKKLLSEAVARAAAAESQFLQFTEAGRQTGPGAPDC